MPIDRTALEETLSAATAELMASRLPDGYWEGELSSSALSTATAVTALTLVDRQAHELLIRHGLDWLAANQNPDGGWGDTVRSESNISTTALGWAAFGAAGIGGHSTFLPLSSRGASGEGVSGGAGGNRAADARKVECPHTHQNAYLAAADRAERWLGRHSKGLRPEQIAEAITRRYGKDRTFSVPILLTCVLGGRLGAGRDAWRLVRPLPFELAACPHRWFQWLRLPVVSYALPALIAIGQARYHHRPPLNPVARLLRFLTRGRTLEILKNIQPESGGFLEAVPLTSFVTMSLASIGQASHPVAVKAVEFLTRAVRSDGSWPIDMNVAVWLTTLSVGALAAGGLAHMLSAEERAKTLLWLLERQHRELHPYTHAAPGGWAWTHLPGGVPDADDTAGALLALRHLAADSGVAPERILEAAGAGVAWLLGLQNRDGGVPTYCRGWGALPFDRSSADLTAHALRAWVAWLPDLSPELRRRTEAAIPRAIAFLARVQRVDGTWAPLWFGNERADKQENSTYGTARVVQGLAALGPRWSDRVLQMMADGGRWFVGAQNSDGGWGGDCGVPSSIEETALAVEALAALAQAPCPHTVEGLDHAIARGVGWLVERTDRGRAWPAAPIGLYFAKLWYFERLYPPIFTVGALGRVRNLPEQA